MGEVASILAAVIPLLIKGVDLISEKIQDRRNGRKNARSLRIVIEDLIASRNDVQRIIERFRQEGQQCNQTDLQWLETANATLEKYRGKKIDRIEKQELEDVRSLIDKGYHISATLEGYSEPIPKFPSGDKQFGLDSHIAKILHYIEDDQVDIIGIWGMGGVGKTTLLKSIEKKFHIPAEQCRQGLPTLLWLWLKEKFHILFLLGRIYEEEPPIMFDHVIRVEMPQGFSELEFQKAIARELNLNLLDSTRGESERILLNFLRNKNFLLLIDGLWTTFNPESVGIPRRGADGKRHKIIFTTRSKTVCNQMRCAVLKLECLKSDDAWSLFEEEAGPTYLNRSINAIARDVAKECCGLPLALILSGRSMQGITDLRAWSHARTSLQDYRPGTIPWMEKFVLRTLKSSYYSLDFADSSRKRFLSCSLWPKNANNIQEEEVINCWMGLGILQRLSDGNISDAYDEGNRCINELQNASLLEAGCDMVRMNGMTHCLGIWIASGGEHSDEPQKVVRTTSREHWQFAREVSLTGVPQVKLPTQLPDCENLSVLMLNRCKVESFPSGFFGRMRSLTYLDLSWTPIKEVPAGINSLLNLRYLNLSRTKINDDSFTKLKLDGLKNLEYFLLRYTDIAKLPHSLISSLNSLSVLDVFPLSSFDSVSTDSLKKLKALGTGLFNNGMSHVELKELPTRWLRIDGIGELEMALHLLSKEMGRCLHELELSHCNHLMELEVGGQLEDGDILQAPSPPLGRLKYLKLKSLQNFKNITIRWNGWRDDQLFERLRGLEIESCCELENISWVQRLPSLVSLKLKSCFAMKQVAEFQIGGETGHAFRTLEVLELRDLPNLCSIYNFNLEFPSLRSVIIDECNELKVLPFNPNMATDNNSLEIQAPQLWWEALQQQYVGANFKTLFRPYFRNLESGRP